MADSFIEALSSGMSVTPTCSVWQLLGSLDEKEREAVIETMRRCASSAQADKQFTFSWLSKLLSENSKGNVAEYSLRRHMRGGCACDGSTR